MATIYWGSECDDCKILRSKSAATVWTEAANDCQRMVVDREAAFWERRHG
jgi:hypothetical protein